MKPYILGVAGGSGSGKSYLAKAIYEDLGSDECSLIYQDNYYFDMSSRFDHDGGSVNFDHPSAIDFHLLATHLAELKNGRSIRIPTYDFATHSRLNETINQAPRRIIIVDGILILNDPEMRAQFDESIFVDTSEQLRFARRLERDVNERGRTEAGVRSQFENHVKPMHDRFVQPSKQHAGIVFEDSHDSQAFIQAMLEKLRAV